jgi:2-keto-4-pentenoate hydratase/2-oxohepta-3-ene-1,7-dioic acid hydratase in catechol pathway
MKLCRFESQERIHLGVIAEGEVVDVASLFEGVGYSAPEAVASADLRAIAVAPAVVTTAIEGALGRGVRGDRFSPDSVRFLAPVPIPRKIICVGLNYRDHCDEQAKEVPKSPVIFAKFANTVCGNGDTVAKPSTTEKMDFEGELAVVIGEGGRGIARADALRHVFGYTIVNDLTARDLQKLDGQWLRAKSQDGFAPMGPVIATADEVPDPQALDIRTRVNGELMQESNTRHMVFPVDMLIEFISAGISLEPGDIISTGTPSGVGVHRTTPVFLQPGDSIEVEIPAIGKLLTRIG